MLALFESKQGHGGKAGFLGEFSIRQFTSCGSHKLGELAVKAASFHPFTMAKRLYRM